MDERDERDERAYRAVVAYKLGKAAVETIAALILIVVANYGVADHLHRLAVGLRVHVVHRATLDLLDLIATVTTPEALGIAAAGLGIDGLLSGFEGWALRRRYRWAPWVVVVTSALLVPAELVELYERPSLGRFALLVINLAVVVVLMRRALHHHRAQLDARESSGATREFGGPK